jgi:hypothetical protein
MRFESRYIESRYILPFWEKVLRFFRSPGNFLCSRVRSNLLIPALRMLAWQGMAPNLELFDMLAFTNGAINSKDQASHNHINSNQYIFQGKGSWRCRGALSLSQQQLYLKSPRKHCLRGGYILSLVAHPLHPTNHSTYYTRRQIKPSLSTI